MGKPGQVLEQAPPDPAALLPVLDGDGDLRPPLWGVGPHGIAGDAHDTFIFAVPENGDQGRLVVEVQLGQVDQLLPGELFLGSVEPVVDGLWTQPVEECGEGFLVVGPDGPDLQPSAVVEFMLCSVLSWIHGRDLLSICPRVRLGRLAWTTGRRIVLHRGAGFAPEGP